MLPVKLTLEGIYSYRERQTIDFTRLTEARLFGIFGPVGSGKSTILEAMIYAIYGTIDRLNNDVKYNVMNLQSDRLFVDFEFRAGEDGRLYRATVECRRNKKRFADVSSPKYLYHVWEGDEWLPCTREEVVGAIGLTAQNFKRVVIIPQEVSGVPDVAGQGAYRYDDGAFRGTPALRSGWASGLLGGGDNPAGDRFAGTTHGIG